MKGLSDKGLLRVAGLLRLSDKIPGGKGDGKKPSDFDPEQMEKGLKIEMEHTDDPEVAREIEMDHLSEFDDYYDGLIEMEDDLEKKKRSKYTPLDWPTGSEMELAREIYSAVRGFSWALRDGRSSYPKEYEYFSNYILPVFQDIAINSFSKETPVEVGELEQVRSALEKFAAPLRDNLYLSSEVSDSLDPALEMLSQLISMKSEAESDEYSRSAKRASNTKAYPQGDYPLGVAKEDIAMQSEASEDQDFLDEEMGERGIRNALLRRLAAPKKPQGPGKGKRPSRDWYSEWERQKEDREDELQKKPIPGTPDGPEVLDEDWDVEVDIERDLIDDDSLGISRRDPDSIGDGSDVWWPYTGDDDDADGEPGK